VSTEKVKYPRTYHLPWSPGLQNDDRRIETLEFLEKAEVVVTIKWDGENTSFYRDFVHARSLDSGHHESRDAVKNIWGAVRYDIPEGFRICGENLYAKHSIGYDNLESYFLGFGVWDRMTCLSWKETKEWLSLLGLSIAPVIYEGLYNEDALRNLVNSHDEGFVVRVKESFTYDEFAFKVAKYVRSNHVQTSEHWMSQKIEPNKLKETP
jgi:hypothetical protein